MISPLYFATNARYKLLALGCMLLLGLCVTSCNEVKYRFFASSASGYVTRVSPSKSGGERVSYEFSLPDGTRQSNFFTTSSVGLAPPVGTTFEVHYINGGYAARPATMKRLWPLVMIGVLVCYLAFEGLRFWLDYRAHMRRVANSSD